jgi:phage-related protein
MSFNAGEIIATLKLDRTQFNLDLDKAVAEADAKVKDGVEFPVKPSLDTVAMDEVLLEEEPLRKEIEVSVKPQLSDTSAITTEAELLGKTLPSDILQGMNGSKGASSESNPLVGFFNQMFDQGFTQKEISQWASGLGKSDTQIADAFAKSLGSDLSGGGGSTVGATLASDIAKYVMPNSTEMDNAINKEMGLGKYSSLWPEIMTALASDMGSGGGGKAPEGPSPLASYFTSMFAQGVPKSEIVKWAQDMNKPASDIASAFETAFGTALKGGESGGGGFLSSIENWFSSSGSSMSNLGSKMFGSLSIGTGPLAALMNPLGAAAATAFAGAFGLALGGALSATLIGAGGLVAALLPGYLDVTKGLAAYTALSTPGASTKGMSKSQIGLGQSLKGLLGAGSKGLGAAEATIMPQITKFVNALTKAIPLMNEFAKPAIKAMSGFFNVIDKGLGSKGFSSFMAQMSKLVGPIMKEFGQVVINLVTAFGGFLKLFGGVGANQIGPWFVKITGEFSHFMNHVKLGKGFVAGMTTVFSDLGKVLPGIWNLFKELGAALAPVGLQIFRIVGWLGSWTARIVKLIPPPVLAALVVVGALATAFALGLIAIGAGLALVVPLMAGLDAVILVATAPATLMALAVGAITIALYELHKHWRTIWKDIQKVAVASWQFLDKHVIHPLVHFFTVVFKDALNAIKKLWDSVWGDIKKVAENTWKFLDKKILQPIENFFKVVFTGTINLFKKLWNRFWTGLKTDALVIWNFLSKDIFKPLYDFFKTVFVDVMNTFKKLWDRVWTGIKNTVNDVWKVIKPIFDAIKTAIKDITGGISSVTGLAGKIGGGILHGVSNFISHPFGLAGGGTTQANKLQLVGEQGPELFVPHTAGTIIPNGQFGGGGGQNITFMIDARGHANPQQVAQAVRTGIGATLPSLQAALARGAA